MHLRITLALLLALILVACGNQQESLPPDSLRITITGLPNAEDGKTDPIPANVRVTGPNGFDETITAGALLTDLPSGTYSVTVGDAHFGTSPFEPLTRSSSATLSPGGNATLTVRYAPHVAYSQAAIAHMNLYRLANGLTPATLDAEGSLPNWLHARYASLTLTTGHYEEAHRPWYSAAGHGAAQRSNLAYKSTAASVGDPTWSIETWAQAPFHFMHMLDPRVSSIRFGEHSAQGEEVWCPPDGLGGPCYRRQHTAALEPVQTLSWPAGKAVLYPPPDWTLESGSFWGENPSPVVDATCAPFGGAGVRFGMPVFAMFGPNTTPSLRAGTSITHGGSPIEYCWFTGATYTNPDATVQSRVRQQLIAYGGVVLVPTRELAPASEYTVTLVTQHGTTSWSFRTAAELRHGPPNP
jgi:hypothetical protein